MKTLKSVALPLLLAACCVFFAACGAPAPAATQAPPATSTPAAATPATSTPAPTPEQSAAPEETACPLADGEYIADVDTDSSMFHLNEASEGKGTLTVRDGKMTVHISMPSKSIVNLFPGTAEDAKKEDAELLEPTLDTVTYKDGISEEVYGFDIPVPYLDETFDCAIIGTHGNWYDHKISVSNPVPAE